MILSVKELYVDDILLPTPKLGGLTITPNKMWSANTGRLESSGEMVGTIVAIKRKISIKWPDLTMDQIQIIEAAVSSMTAFHKLTYTDMTGQTHELQVYFGDPTYTIYAYSEGIQLVRDAAVDAIAK